MPFPEQEPRAFDRQSIESISPRQLGCYGIFRHGGGLLALREWIYVGKGDIRNNMLAHLGGDNPRITRERPTHWVSVVTADMDAEEKRLIVELNPIANQRIG